jgi:hypothetical protein
MIKLPPESSVNVRNLRRTSELSEYLESENNCSFAGLEKGDQSPKAPQERESKKRVKMSAEQKQKEFEEHKRVLEYE